MQGKMRVSNIYNSLNFGKTVRVNMSVEDAFTLVSCINSPKTTEDKIQLQQDAKSIFDDTNKGAPVFCSPDSGKTCYILSGEEARTLSGIRKSALSALEAIGTFYEEGPFSDKNIEYICKKEKKDVAKLINSTKENYVLTVCNDNETGLPRLSKLRIIG